MHHQAWRLPHSGTPALGASGAAGSFPRLLLRAPWSSEKPEPRRSPRHSNLPSPPLLQRPPYFHFVQFSIKTKPRAQSCRRKAAEAQMKVHPPKSVPSRSPKRKSSGTSAKCMHGILTRFPTSAPFRSLPGAGLWRVRDSPATAARFVMQPVK